MDMSERTCSACHTPLPVDAAFCPACGAPSSPGVDSVRSLPPRPSDPGGRYFDFIRYALREKYVIERELGRGGMAVVYLARDLKHPRRVAIKIMQPDVTALIGPDRFVREIEITAQLQHPNILPIHDSGRVGDVLYYVMPFVEGESLRDYLNRERQLTLKETLTIIGGVGHALSYAHAHGVIHRDIKPENILLTSGHPQVADFGVARAVSEAGGTITRTGAMVGTPAYMAPEQAAGLPDIDGRADLYALAAVACELLAGKRTDTLKDTQDSQHALMAARPDLPLAVARTLTAPLAFDRDRRPASVDEWLEMIRDAERRRGGKGMTATIGVAAVVILAVLGWLMLSGGEAASVRSPTIAVVPFRATGTVDSALRGLTLANAFEDQLHWLAEYQVLSATRVREAVAGHFGTTEPGLDTLIRFVTTTFEATEVLWGRFEGLGTGHLQLDVQVVGADGTSLGNASVTGSADSLSVLVKEAVLEAFAERVVAARTGWSAALPEGLEAVRAYYAGDTEFRRGAYDLAIQRFQEVVDRDTAFALAHFKLMLSEILNVQPTRATTAVRAALGAARRYKTGLDPTTRELLEGYEILVADGDVQRALEMFSEITQRNPQAVDAWFVIGYLQINFAALLGMRPEQARFAFLQANELDPEFAAAIAQLFRLAVLEESHAEASRHAARYLALDSASPTAEIIRMVDSAITGGAREQVRIMGSFADRSATVLETIALSAGEFRTPGTDREGSQAAIDALWRRAATALDRSVAFRMKMALHLGAGQVGSASAFMNDARRGPMRQSERGQAELDGWSVLCAVAKIPLPSEERDIAAAAQRLVEKSDDATAQWLAARWYGGRDIARSQRARERLRALATVDAATPLERSLVADLDALELLAATDTAGAVSTWSEATRRYNVEEVIFGMVGSLWPLHLEWARVAEAYGDEDEVLAATASFEHMAGFIDQVAWTEVWPMRARALQSAGDVAGAREVYLELRDLLDDADGSGAAIRDSVEAWLERMPRYQRVGG